LEFALKELHNKNSFDAGNRRAVVLFTDGKPRLPASEFFGEEKQRYFRGGPIAGGEANYPLARIAHELQDSAVKLYMIAVGDDPKDAELWKTLLPSYHYHPINRTTDLSELYRGLFFDLLDIGITLQKSRVDSLPRFVDTSQNLRQQLCSWIGWLILALLIAGMLLVGYNKVVKPIKKIRKTRALAFASPASPDQWPALGKYKKTLERLQDLNSRGKHRLVKLFTYLIGIDAIDRDLIRWQTYRGVAIPQEHRKLDEFIKLIMSPTFDNQELTREIRTFVDSTKEERELWWNLVAFLARQPREQLKRVAFEAFDDAMSSADANEQSELLTELTYYGAAKGFKERWSDFISKT